MGKEIKIRFYHTIERVGQAFYRAIYILLEQRLSCYEPNSSCSTTPSVGSIVGESGGEAPSGEGSTTRARLDSSPTVHVRFPVSAAFVVVVVVSYVSRIGSSRAVLLLSRFPEHSFTGNEVSAKFIG